MLQPQRPGLGQSAMALAASRTTYGHAGQILGRMSTYCRTDHIGGNKTHTHT